MGSLVHVAFAYGGNISSLWLTNFVAKLVRDFSCFTVQLDEKLMFLGNIKVLAFRVRATAFVV
jgi:hypothetical protein